MPRPIVNLLVILLVPFWACNDSASEQTEDGEIIIWVNSKVVDCTGVAPQKCLQYKETEDGDWQNMYSPIIGFEHEEGMLYKLKVKVEQLENVPADASSLRYELVQIMNKRPDPDQHVYRARPDLYITKWRLKSYTDADGKTTRINDEHVVTLEVDESTSKVSGIAACNNYFGQAEINGSEISIAGIGTTRKMCADESAMELEQTYTKMLSNVTTIQPAKSVFMTMITSDGGELHFIPAGRKDG
jgi:heat shock protein HslJ